MSPTLAPHPELLEMALQYAERGIPVQPGHHVNGGTCSCKDWATCKDPGRHPRTDKNGKAIPYTTDARLIQEYWGLWPWAFPRIQNGPTSGLLLLDVDHHAEDQDGSARLAELEAEHGALPETWTYRTPRGGQHRYFVATLQGTPKKASPAGPRKGLELFYGGNPGTAPPAWNAEGKKYEWIPSLSPFDMDCAPAPEWLTRFLTTQRIDPEACEHINHAEWAEGVLRRHCESVAVERDGYLTRCPAPERHTHGDAHPSCFWYLAGPQGQYLRPYCRTQDCHEAAPDGLGRQGLTRRAGFAPGEDRSPESRNPETAKPSDPERFVNVTVGGWELLQKDLPEPVSIIGDGLMCRGDLGTLFGENGAGKSQLLLQLAVARALGIQWIGFDVDQGRTGLLLMELDGYAWQQRIRAIAGDLAGEALDAIRVVCRPELRGIVSLNTDDGMTELRRWIERERLTLAGLDPLFRLHSEDENDARGMGMLVQRFDALRADTGCGLFIPHHTRKGQAKGKDSPRDAGRGSGVLSDATAVYALLQKKWGLFRVLQFGRTSRAADPEPVWLLRADKSAVLTVTKSPGETGDANRTRVLESVRKLGVNGAKREAIAADVNLSDSTVKKYLGELEEARKAHKIGSTRATLWWPGPNPAAGGVAR